MNDPIRMRLDAERYVELDLEHLTRLAIHITMDYVEYVCHLERTEDNLLSREPIRRWLEKASAEFAAQGYDFLRCNRTGVEPDKVIYMASFGKRGCYTIKNYADLPSDDPFRDPFTR